MQLMVIILPWNNGRQLLKYAISHIMYISVQCLIILLAGDRHIRDQVYKGPEHVERFKSTEESNTRASRLQTTYYLPSTQTKGAG